MSQASGIYVAGHCGLVGSALLRQLGRQGHSDVLVKTREELDLRDQQQVDAFFKLHRPRQVYLAAARVGGIHANNTYPVDFVRDNLLIATHVIHAAHHASVERLLFLGSSCIYPRDRSEPLREKDLLTGPLEPTNEAYAVAKIAGITLCRSYRKQHGSHFISVMPTNLYGPRDNFDLKSSHVLPALIRKFHEAKEQRSPTVALWGTGAPRREFLHVDDLARACTELMSQPRLPFDIYNVGTGEDLTIRELASLVAQVVGYTGQTTFDPSMPDGTRRKVLDVARIRELGWRPQVPLRDGIKHTYRWYLDSLSDH